MINIFGGKISTFREPANVKYINCAKSFPIWERARLALPIQGIYFGDHLSGAKVGHLVTCEWVQTPEDILTFHTKHALHLTPQQGPDFIDW